MSFMKHILAAGLFTLAATQVAAQDKTIRIVVPYAAGGAADVMGRLVARQLGTQMGVPVVVENLAGASGTLGSNQVRRSAPDGRTIVLGTAASHGTNSIVLKANPYDSIKDFTPVIHLAEAANAFYVPSSLPANNLQDLVVMFRAKPGQAYATSGAGSLTYLTGEYFKIKAKVDITAVHYNGLAPATRDMLGGHLSVGIGDLVSLKPQLDSGAFKLLAVTTASRSAAMPLVPTFKESGIDIVAPTWWAFFAPPGTPNDVAMSLNAEIWKAVQSPEVKSRLEGMNAVLTGGSPDDLRRYVQAEIQKWTEVVKQGRLTFE